MLVHAMVPFWRSTHTWKTMPVVSVAFCLVFSYGVLTANYAQNSVFKDKRCRLRNRLLLCSLTFRRLQFFLPSTPQGCLPCCLPGCVVVCVGGCAALPILTANAG